MPANMESKTKTKRLIYKLTRNSPDMLVQSSQAVDTKMVGVVAAASVVIGVVAAAIGKDDKTTDTALCLIVLAVVMYAVVLASGAWCLWPRKFRRPMSPPLLEKHKGLRAKILLEWHGEYVKQAYTKNKSLLDQKIWSLYVGLIGLAAETTLIVSWMIVEVLAG